MLAYLENLCAALLARDAVEIRRLLRHPLARALPRGVREEAFAIARAGDQSMRAPVQTLHFYHQTTHLLLGADARVRTTRTTTEVVPADQRSATTPGQLELPLAASGE